MTDEHDTPKPSRTRKLGLLAATALAAAAILTGCSSDPSPQPAFDTIQGPPQSVEPAEGAESNPSHAEGSEGTGQGGSGEINEAAMSSPTIALSDGWTGNLGGLDTLAMYIPQIRTVRVEVTNATDTTLCYVQSEPHMKSGTQTVGELGPDQLGDLSPGQTAMSELSVDDEPSLDGVAYDGYVVHLEIFDCNGPGPVPHSSEAAEGPGGHAEGNEAGSESGGEGPESGDTSAMLNVGQTYDTTRNGARLVLAYDDYSNSFEGSVTNVTGAVLTRVRVEIHLSNGIELGPTTPTDLAPGESLPISLDAGRAPFDTWSPHAEVGSGEGGGEGSEGAGHTEANEGSEGSEGSGEESGEHGPGGEGGTG